MSKVFKPICLMVALALVLSLGMVLLPAEPADSMINITGSTIYVDANDGDDVSGDGSELNPYQSITRGLQAASSLVTDEIIVLDGTYTPGVGIEAFPITIDKSVVIHSDAGYESTIIDAAGADSTVVIIDPDYADSVIFEGFTITGSAIPTTGIHVGSVSTGDSITIDSCYVYDNVGDGIMVDYIGEGGEVTIESCIIDDNSSNGIRIGMGEGDAMNDGTLYIGDSIIADYDEDEGANASNGIYFYGDVDNGSSVTIDYNDINNNGSSGIYFDDIFDESTVTIVDCDIIGNTSYGIYADEINDSTVTIDYCDIQDNSYGICVSGETVANGSTLDITDNDISGNANDGILLDYIEYSTVTIYYNDINGNGDDGIYISTTSDSDVNIEDNDINENGGDGIYIGYSAMGTTTITENNILENSANGIFLYYTYYDHYTEISYNIITDNNYDGILIVYVYDVSQIDIFCNTIAGNNGSGAKCGVYVYYMDDNYQVSLVGCNDFLDNESHDVYNDSGKWIDASENWWGDPSGPGDDDVYGKVICDEPLSAPCGEEEECPTPTASISASILMGEAPLTVQFRGYSDQSDVTWDWSFGQTGDGSDSRSPAYTFQNEGTYEVTLTVTNECGESAMDSVVITVEDGGTAPSLVVSNLNINPTYARYGEPVYITAMVSNVGGSWGSDDIDMLINGEFEQSVPVGLAAGSSQTIAFTVYRTEAREYQVTIGAATGTFYLMEEAAQQTQRSGLLAGGELGTGGIIAIICIGVILVGGVVIIFLFARRPS